MVDGAKRDSRVLERLVGPDEERPLLSRFDSSIDTGKAWKLLNDGKKWLDL